MGARYANGSRLLFLRGSAAMYLSNNDLEPTSQLVTLEALFQAYFDCRRNKRNTINALAFEADYESHLVALCDELNDGSYVPGRSLAFVIQKPVKREIFAADFRDRVVHHWLINQLNPLFERAFIYDSYASRKDRGAHFGILRADRFIRQCSENYTTDCYILKLDIMSFFMCINRCILLNSLNAFIEQRYTQHNKAIVLEVANKIIMNDPTKNCFIKGARHHWDGFPLHKSLFHAPPDCGLPIGNLTSQVFANFYMNAFDHFVKHHLGVRYYGRYVDDFLLVHYDGDYLKSLIPVLADFLTSKLALTNQNYFSLSLISGIQEISHIGKINHTCFVDDQNMVFRKL